ncbi:MAG: hypothetical protein IJ848_01945 [Alphaproteobacteria bacterium]|nr:hypothetical protein [Alphaproteobacteria bacterium]
MKFLHVLAIGLLIFNNISYSIQHDNVNHVNNNINHISITNNEVKKCLNHIKLSGNAKKNLQMQLYSLIGSEDNMPVQTEQNPELIQVIIDAITDTANNNNNTYNKQNLLYNMIRFYLMNVELYQTDYNKFINRRAGYLCGILKNNYNANALYIAETIWQQNNLQNVINKLVFGINLLEDLKKANNNNELYNNNHDVSQIQFSNGYSKCFLVSAVQLFITALNASNNNDLIRNTTFAKFVKYLEQQSKSNTNQQPVVNNINVNNNSNKQSTSNKKLNTKKTNNKTSSTSKNKNNKKVTNKKKITKKVNTKNIKKSASKTTKKPSNNKVKTPIKTQNKKIIKQVNNVKVNNNKTNIQPTQKLDFIKTLEKFVQENRALFNTDKQQTALNCLFAQEKKSAGGAEGLLGDIFMLRIFPELQQIFSGNNFQYADLLLNTTNSFKFNNNQDLSDQFNNNNGCNLRVGHEYEKCRIPFNSTNYIMRAMHMTTKQLINNFIHNEKYISYYNENGKLEVYELIGMQIRSGGALGHYISYVKQNNNCNSWSLIDSIKTAPNSNNTLNNLWNIIQHNTNPMIHQAMYKKIA